MRPDSRLWRKAARVLLVLLTLVVSVAVLPAVQGPPRPDQTSAAVSTPTLTDTLTDEEKEQFLKKGRVIKSGGTKKGITGSTKATLSDGKITHDVHIQTHDEEKAKFEGKDGVEFNFRDTWRFYVAGYRLDRLIGLNMVPVSVSRAYNSKPASYTWWIDDVIMDEVDRKNKNIQPPDIAAWNEQMQLVRVFDQLIYNVDRNMTNILITKDWRIWAIDHGRAFRRMSDLKSPANLTHCDRQLLERMKALDEQTLKKTMKDFLGEFEIKPLLARRDKIVKHFESLGPSAMFDRRVLHAAGSQ
jgi:hypothetical protein